MLTTSVKQTTQLHELHKEINYDRIENMTTPQGPQVSANDIIARLSGKVADQTLQITILEAQVEALTSLANENEQLRNKSESVNNQHVEAPAAASDFYGPVVIDQPAEPGVPAV